jgi:TPR repeat protein
MTFHRFSQRLTVLIFLAMSLNAHAWMPDQFYKNVENRDFLNAYRIAVPLSLIGNAEAKYWAAWMVLIDELPGVKGDKEKARKMLLEAANSNFSAAQKLVASSFEEGKYGFPKNISEAIHWYEKAFKNGDKSSSQELGLLFLGMGNMQAAKHWLKISALNGSKISSDMLDAIEKDESRLRQRSRMPQTCMQVGDILHCL